MTGPMRELTPEEIAAQIVRRKRPRAWLANDLEAVIARAERRGTVALDVDRLGRAYHGATQIGGPFTPCLAPYGQAVDCLCREMAMDIADHYHGAATEPRPS